MAGCNDPNENQSGNPQYYSVADPQSSSQENIGGEHAFTYEGQGIGENAANSGYKPAAEGQYGENDCFKVVRSTKQIDIPCTRNEYQRYKVKVPKQVAQQVPRRVEYMDYETRERQEPYFVKRFETAYRDEDQQYTVQVPKTVTRMMKVTRKMPKTVYVDVVVEEPREVTIMAPETRKRSVRVPYQKEVVEQKYRTVKENVPVTKFRTEYDTVTKTVYEDEWQTKAVPVTKMVRKELPVYDIVRNENCADCVQIDAYPASYDQVQPTVQMLPESSLSYEETMKPYVENYPRLMETHPEPVPTYQVAEQYEPQPVINAQVIEDHDLTPANQRSSYAEPVQVMQDSAYVTPANQRSSHAEPVQVMQDSAYVPTPANQRSSYAEPVQVMQDSAYVPVIMEPAPVMKTAEPAQDANATKPHDEQKVEKYSVTQYSAPAEYDTNEDGVLDAQERGVAQADGNLHVERSVVVENQKELGAAVQEFSKPQSEIRVTRKKKSGGRRRKRRSRR